MRPAFAHPWRGSSDAACELYMYIYICVSRISVILCPLSLSTLGCVGREEGGRAGGRQADGLLAGTYRIGRVSVRSLWPKSLIFFLFSLDSGAAGSS